MRGGRRVEWYDAVFFGGVAALTWGFALWSVPAALIVVGVIAMVIGHHLSRRAQRDQRGGRR